MEKVMKAAVFHEYGGPQVLEIEEVPLPECEPDEVLVRVRAVCVNRLDLMVQAGLTKVKAPLPHIGGSEVAGEIAQLGATVKGFELGQPVVIAPYFYDGTCQFCRAGEETTCSNGDILGLRNNGGYAEYVKVPGKSLVKIPEELSFEDAAAQTLTTIVAWHALVSKAGVRPGETVLVQAAGSGIGSAAVQIAKMWGARVIATASTAQKLEQASQAGADETINYLETDFYQEVQHLTDQRGADIVIEQLGVATWDKSLACVACNGRLLVCGAATGSLAQVNIQDLFSKQIMIIGSHGGTKEELKEVLRFTAEGRLNATIDKVYSLTQIKEAQERLTTPTQYGKILLMP